MTRRERAKQLILEQRDELLECLSVCRTHLPPDLWPQFEERLAFHEGLVRTNADETISLLHGYMRPE